MKNVLGVLLLKANFSVFPGKCYLAYGLIGKRPLVSNFSVKVCNIALFTYFY